MGHKRMFQVNQKFIAHEDDGTPRLLQAMDAKTLERLMEWLVEEDCHVMLPDRRGYRLPLQFRPRRDENGEYRYYFNTYSHHSLTVYCLPEAVLPDFQHDATGYYEEAIFLSQLDAYTCMALSDDPTLNAIVWSHAASLDGCASKAVGCLSDWELYASLKDSKKLYAVAIDEYNVIQEFVRIYTYSDCCNPCDEDVEAPLPRIGEEWLLSSRDMERMDLHDLFYYLWLEWHFLLNSMPEELQKRLEQDDCEEFFPKCIFGPVEDLLYDHFCAQMQNDPSFRANVFSYLWNLECACRKNGRLTDTFPPKSLLRYLSQILEVVTQKIAPLRRSLPEEVFRSYVDLTELAAFLENIPAKPKEAARIDEICDRLGIARFPHYW